MNLLKKLAFVVSIFFVSVMFFQLFQYLPSFFPLPDVTPPVWSWFERYFGIRTYEDRKEFEFLLTVLVSLLISFLCVVLFCRITRKH